jgi:hypothetical protein
MVTNYSFAFKNKSSIIFMILTGEMAEKLNETPLTELPFYLSRLIESPQRQDPTKPP